MLIKSKISITLGIAIILLVLLCIFLRLYSSAEFNQFIPLHPDSMIVTIHQSGALDEKLGFTNSNISLLYNSLENKRIHDYSRGCLLITTTYNIDFLEKDSIVYSIDIRRSCGRIFAKDNVYALDESFMSLFQNITGLTIMR